MKQLDIQKTKKIIYPLRLTEEDYKLLIQLAKKNRTSIPKVVRAIIKDYFELKLK